MLCHLWNCTKHVFTNTRETMAPCQRSPLKLEPVEPEWFERVEAEVIPLDAELEWKKHQRSLYGIVCWNKLAICHCVAIPPTCRSEQALRQYLLCLTRRTARWVISLV